MSAQSVQSGEQLDSLITQNLPRWLTSASPERLRALNTCLTRQLQVQDQLRALYGQVVSLDDFAAPLLQQALREHHDLQLDVRHAKVRLKVVLPTAVATLLGKPTEQVFEHTLLEAALHNFSAAEATSLSGTTLLDAKGEVLALSPEAFAGLCRTLDVGKRYQDYLKAHFQPGGQPQAQVNRTIEEGHRLALEAETRLAALSGELDEHSFQALRLVMTNATAEATVDTLVPHRLRLFGKLMRGVMAFEVRQGSNEGPLQGVLCWLPGDRQGAVSRFANWARLFDYLGKLFRLPGYDAYFQRFVGEPDRMAFARALTKARAGRAEHLPVELDGRHEALIKPLFQYLREEQIATLFANARLLAVPTADQDSAERDHRLHFYLDAGLTVLGLASLFVPWLGLPLLAFAAAEVASNVYEGYADWSLGDRQGAIEHLLGAAENVALIAVGVGVGVVANRVLKSSAFVRRLVPVPAVEDGLRLMHPDLPGYEVLDDTLAVGERNEALGEQRLRTHAATYRVEQDPVTRQLCVLHPTRTEAYRPLLEHNGEGGWRHELEVPQRWQGNTLLFRRLGSQHSDVPEETITDVLQSTGFGEAQLRELHVGNQPAPARLLDALERYRLHQEQPTVQGDAFETLLAARQAPDAPAERVLRASFPGLSPRGARQIIAKASGRKVQTMLTEQKVPLELAGQARLFIKESRLDRACAGLRQVSAINADTERLALKLIADWAPWPGTDSLQLRQQSMGGELIARVGGSRAQRSRFIVRTQSGYTAYDASGQRLGNHLDGSGLLEALRSQLTDTQRQRMGAAADSASQLAQGLADRAFQDRHRAARLLGLQPLASAYVAPVRLPDGRLGYPMSGLRPSALSEGETLVQPDEVDFPPTLDEGLLRLFPQRSAAELQAYSQALRSVPGGDTWRAYRALVREVRALRTSLENWQGADPQRAEIARRLIDAWQPVLTGETPEFRLVLEGDSNGQIAELDADVNWGRLTELSLSHVDLSTFDSTLPSRLSNLRSLSLTDSALAVVPDWLENLQQLSHLSLGRNSLSSLPSSFGRLNRLTDLDLASNSFTSIPEVFEQFSGLRRLNLDNNRIVLDTQGVERLERLERLEELILNHSPLGQVPELPRAIFLERVALRFCELETFPVGLLRQHPGLRLSLEGNRITELDDEVLQLARNDRFRVNLDYNDLSPATVTRLQAEGARVRAAILRDVDYTSSHYRDPWLIGLDPQARQQREAQWGRIADMAEARPLMAFLADLVSGAEFARGPGVMRGRVWQLLDACETSEEVRSVLFSQSQWLPDMATQGVYLLRLMETLAADVQRAGLFRGHALEVELMRNSRAEYRASELYRRVDDYIRRAWEAGQEVNPDVVLQRFFQALAQPLDLDLGQLGIVLPADADQALPQIAEEELRAVQDGILREETPEAISRQLVESHGWQVITSERFEDTLNALNEEFADRLEQAMEEGENDGERLAQAAQIGAQRNAAIEAYLFNITLQAYKRFAQG